MEENNVDVTNSIEVCTLSGQTYIVPSVDMNTFKQHIDRVSGIPKGSQLLLTSDGQELSSLNKVGRLFVIDKREIRGVVIRKTEANVTVPILQLPVLPEYQPDSLEADSINKRKMFLYSLKTHNSKLKAVFDSAEKKMQMCVNCLKEQKIQCTGYQAAIQYMNETTVQFLKTAKEWKEYSEASRRENLAKIDKMNDTISKLSSIELEPALQTGSLRNLIDVITVNVVKELYIKFRDSQESMDLQLKQILTKVDELEQRKNTLQSENQQRLIELVDFKTQTMSLETAERFLSDMKKEVSICFEDYNRLAMSIAKRETLPQIDTIIQKLPSDKFREQQIKDVISWESQISKVLETTIKEKSKIIKITTQKQKIFSQSWVIILDFRNSLDTFYESHRLHKDLRKRVNNLESLPQTYKSCLEEVKRRKVWGKKYREELDRLQHMFKAITEEELGKRLQFFRKYSDRGIPKVIFPGLTQQLPVANVTIEDFDTELPKIESDVPAEVTFSVRRSFSVSKLEEEVSRLQKENGRLSTLLQQSSSVSDGQQQTLKYQKKISKLEKLLASSRNEVESLLTLHKPPIDQDEFTYSASQKTDQEKTEPYVRIDGLQQLESGNKTLKLEAAQLELNSQLAEKKAEIETLLKQSAERKSQLENLELELKKKTSEITTMEEKFSEINSKFQKLKELNEKNERALANAVTNQDILKIQNEDLKEKQLQKETEISGLNSKLKTYQQQFSELSENNKKLSEKRVLEYSVMEKFVTTVGERDKKISSLEESIREKDNKISSLEESIREKNNKISSLEESIREKNNKISSLEESIREKNNKISSLEESIKEKYNKISSLEESIKEKNNKISSLEDSIGLINQKVSSITKDRDSQFQKFAINEKKLSNEIKELQSEHEVLRANLNEMDNRLKQTSRERDRLSDEIAHVVEDLDNIDTILNLQNLEKQSLKVRINTLLNYCKRWRLYSANLDESISSNDIVIAKKGYSGYYEVIRLTNKPPHYLIHPDCINALSSSPGYGSDIMKGEIIIVKVIYVEIQQDAHYYVQCVPVDNNPL